MSFFDKIRNLITKGSYRDDTPEEIEQKKLKKLKKKPEPPKKIETIEKPKEEHKPIIVKEEEKPKAIIQTKVTEVEKIPEIKQEVKKTQSELDQEDALRRLPDEDAKQLFPNAQQKRNELLGRKEQPKDEAQNIIAYTNINLANSREIIQKHARARGDKPSEAEIHSIINEQLRDIQKQMPAIYADTHDGLTYAQSMKDAVLRYGKLDPQIADMIVTNAELFKPRFTTTIELDVTTDTNDDKTYEIICTGAIPHQVQNITEQYIRPEETIDMNYDVITDLQEAMTNNGIALHVSFRNIPASRFKLHNLRYKVDFN